MTTQPHPIHKILGDQAALAKKETARYDACKNAVEPIDAARPTTHEGTQARAKAYRSGRLRSQKQEDIRTDKIKAEQAAAGTVSEPDLGDVVEAAETLVDEPAAPLVDESAELAEAVEAETADAIVNGEDLLD